MAELPEVKTQGLTRDEMPFARSLRQINFFEALAKDVGEILPEAAQSASAAADAAQVSADAAQITADGAAAEAAAAKQAADDAFGLATEQDEAPSIIAMMQAEIHALTARVRALEERPTP